MSKTRVWVLWGLAIISLLSGCKNTRSHSYHYSNQPNIEIHLLEGDNTALSGQNNHLERQWTSQNPWYPKSSQVWLNLETTYDTQDHQSTHQSLLIEEEDEIAWPRSGQPAEFIELYFESDLGTVHFSGETEQNSALGRVNIKVNSESLARLEDVFEESPSLKVILPLICKKVDTNDLIEYADCGVKINISQAGDLARYDFRANDIQALIRAGHTFEAEDYVELASHHVPSEYIITWKQQEYTLSAEQLVYAHQRNLNASMAKQWKDIGYDVKLEKVYWIKNRNLKPDSVGRWNDAGYKLTLEQLYWIHNRNLKAASAIEWKQAEYDLNLEQLYWVKNRNLQPASAIAWKTAGYTLDLEQLYWVKSRNLHPKTASAWKHAGYDLNLEELYHVKNRNLSPHEAGKWIKANYRPTLEELYALNRHNVSADYGAAFSDPAYESISIQDLIKFKQSNISEDTIRKLRQPKKP